VSLELQGISGERCPPPWGGLFHASVAAAVTPLDHVLAGMAAAGFGVEALCLYLGLERHALYERVAALGLGKPCERPIRRHGGKRAWTDGDVRFLISLWVEGVHARSIAERLGRSRGGVWAKARRLGLPARKREYLFYKSFVPHEPAPSKTGDGNSTCCGDVSIPTARASCGAEGPAASPPLQPAPSSPAAPRRRSAVISASLPVSCFAPAPGAAVYETGVPVTRNGVATSQADVPEEHGGGHSKSALLHGEGPVAETGEGRPTPVILPDCLGIGEAKGPAKGGKRGNHKAAHYLTDGEKREVERRGFAGQHSKAIARDMGLTFGQVASHLSCAGVKRDRSKLVDTYEYDEARADANIKALGYEEKNCNGLVKRRFWVKRRSGIAFCPVWWRARYEKKRNDARYGEGC
jgi:hypothetical protein